MYHVLQGGGDDSGATGGAENGVEGSVGVGDYQWGNGRYGSCVRADVVGWRRVVAEGVADVWDGEVCVFMSVAVLLRYYGDRATIHLVVEYHAC